MELSQYYDAQMAVLGSLLIEPDRLAGQIFHRVRAEDFSAAELRHIFEAAKEVFLSGAPLDAVTICYRAGSSYAPAIRQAMDAPPTTVNVGEYIRILQDAARLRRLNELAAEMAEAATWEEGRQALERAARMLSDRPGRKASTYTELIGRYLDRQNDDTPPWRLDWGIQALNKNLAPSPGWFVILGADSSVGKTALALQMAMSMARAGEKVGFFSYETSRDGIIDRLLANAASVRLRQSKDKSLTDHDFARVSSEGMRAGKIPLTVIESAGYTVDDLRSEILAERYSVVFVDYVQLVPAGKKEDRWQVVTEVSMALHSMAQELGVVVIGLSQVTPPETNQKTGTRRGLRKGDLRESRQLINDADVIMMMDLEDPNNPASRRVLLIDKNKDGPLAKVYLSFDPEYMRFSDGRKPEPVKFEDLQDDGEPIPF